MSISSFPYSIRVSPRARYLRLRVTVEKGLEVVVPRGYDQRRIPTVLSTNRSWVQTALQRVEQVRRLNSSESANAVPTQISLPSIGRVWHVELESTASAQVRVIELGEDRLKLCGRVEEAALCQSALRRWLLRQAHDILIPWLGEVSREMGIPFVRTALRTQKTRWGSCSTRGTISLNVKLLMVEPDLVRYILIHELCHVRHMDHSKRFWTLVSRHYSAYKDAHRRLKVAWRSMPRWVA